jgi:hypothetical protein
MADFGLYSALSQPRRNWAQVRQDRMMELGMLQNMQQDLKQRVDAESQARAGVVEYMNELQKSSVLEGDYERVKAVEEAERKKIVEGIQKAGNNVQKFLNGDGASILNNYRNNIIQSDEMRNAISNKLAFGQAGLDKYMGRIARPTYDEQGNRISFDQQVEQFQNGERERLEYQGSVQPVDMTKIRSTIQSTYGEDRYKRQAAGADDVYNIARELGAEDWMAEDIRDGYAAGVESGAEPLYFNQDTFKEEMNYRIGLARKLAQADATNNSDMWKEYLDGNYPKKITDPNTGELVPAIKNKRLSDGTTVSRIFSNITESVYKRLSENALMPSEDGKGVYYNGGYGDAKVFTNGKSIDITGYTFSPEDIQDFVTEYEVDENDREAYGKNYYMRVKIDLPEKQERRGGVNEGDDFWDIPFFAELGGNPYNNPKTDVLIPIDPRAFSIAQGNYSSREEKKYNEQISSDANLLEGILTTPY